MPARWSLLAFLSAGGMLVLGTSRRRLPGRRDDMSVPSDRVGSRVDGAPRKADATLGCSGVNSVGKK